MPELRITDKFAKALNAFRGRDVLKMKSEKYLVRLWDQMVFTWPNTSTAIDIFMSINSTKWFVLGSAVDAEELYARQEKVRHLKNEFQCAMNHDYAMRDRVAKQLSSKHRSKIVLLMYRFGGKDVTVDEMRNKLLHGHELLNIGVRSRDNDRQTLFIVVLSIPGARNKEVTQHYLIGPSSHGIDAHQVLDIESTVYGTGNFADNVIEVIY